MQASCELRREHAEVPSEIANSTIFKLGAAQSEHQVGPAKVKNASYKTQLKLKMQAIRLSAIR